MCVSCDKYQLRYTGGMVPDVNQILVKGKGALDVGVDVLCVRYVRTDVCVLDVRTLPCVCFGRWASCACAPLRHPRVRTQLLMFVGLWTEQACL